MLAPDVAHYADPIDHWLEAGEQVWLSGPAGSGRTTLTSTLIESLRLAVLVDLPSLDEADAGAALALLTLCAVPGADREGLDQAPLRVIVAAIDRNATLIVRVPFSWSSPSSDPGHRRAREELARLAAVRRVLWIADGGMNPGSLGIHPDRRLSLAAHRVPFTESFDWGGYQGHAERLRGALAATSSTSPVIWRFAVGVVALGSEPRRIATLCAESPGVSLRGLLRELVAKLDSFPDVTSAVLRFLRARRPLPAAVALEIAAPPPQHEALITHCLGYGDPLEVSSSLRVSLERKLHEHGRVARHKLDDDRVHLRLAEHHRVLDGTLRPAATRGWGEMTAWVEKVHHLAHAGEAGIVEWQRQRLPRRELYWDRTRHLSVACHDYLGAAAVYDACIRQFPEDDYALHYRAYNLHRARGRVTSDVLQGYDDAIEKAPDNPWWNSRKVTALIGAKRPIEARRAWQEAIDRIDPEGTRVEHDPWLVIHFHYWVAKAWLDSGAWCTARSILDGIPDSIMNEVERVRVDIVQMRERIDQAEASDWQAFDVWLTSHADDAWRPVKDLVERLRSKVPGLPPPIATDGEDGPSLAWSRPGVYVVMELHESGLVDWFASDRVDGREGGVDEPVRWDDDELIGWLEQARRE